MSDMRELQKRIIAFRDARDWKQFHNPKDVAISLSLEAAELLEHFQWKSKEEIEQHIKTHKNEIGDEVVDVLYWILLLAHDLEIDIDTAFDKKMKKNEAKYPAQKSKGSHKKYTELD
jgi:NTP pyrophosphatase (non-canonical NTP hydrolase)